MTTRRLVSTGGMRLRHIAPTATYTSEGGSVTILGRSYGFTELPLSRMPTGADLVEGSHTGRLGDSGEFTLTFPNTAGTRGLWRERFSTDRALEFIEVYHDDELEFVGSIQRIEVDRGSVTVSGTDAWSLLRRAYERDRSWTAAPHEVMGAYTRVPVALLADGFDGASLSGSWTAVSTNSPVVSNGGVLLGGGASVSLTRSVTVNSDTWRVAASFTRFNGGGNPNALISVTVRNSAAASIAQVIYGPQNTMSSSGNPTVQRVPDPLPGSTGRSNIVIERRGRWMYGYVNGDLVGIFQRSGLANATPTDIRIAASGTTIALVVDEVTVTEYQAMLTRGADTGDHVLPGDYPTGGLRGRYFDDADMQGLSSSERGQIVMAPNRDHYAERLDPVLNTAAGLTLPIQPGNSGDYFSVRWFGAVYLRGDLGNYTFETTSVLDGVRVWVGTTNFTSPLITNWTTSSGTTTGTWNAANHGSDAGWYPIIVEYFCDTGTPAFRLQFTPPGAGTYTDPGGATVTRGTKVTVPATSLSPLGCFDGRIQGQSHFDVVQNVATQYGYQLRCEPMSLESGEFPGRLVPRGRVGRDTDIVLEIDDTDLTEPVMSPAVTIDGSDQVVNLIGSGSGLADGAGSQVTAEISDAATLTTGLFALEGVVDAGEIGFTALLEARLNAELALRLTPWEEVRGTPLAMDRLADTWPLTQSLSAMRWTPGDGVRLHVPDINVRDTATRQLLQVTRTYTALGRTGTQVAFRQRPRSAARSLRGLVKAALSGQRSYQRQKVTLNGEYVNTAGTSTPAAGYTGYSMVPLLPSDRVVSAVVRVVANSAAQGLLLEVNGVDRTSALGGAWTTIPVSIDITGYATQAAAGDNRLYVRLQNNGGSSTIIQHQLVVEVLR